MSYGLSNPHCGHDMSIQGNYARVTTFLSIGRGIATILSLRPNSSPERASRARQHGFAHYRPLRPG
jgi:hypothetical protein